MSKRLKEFWAQNNWPDALLEDLNLPDPAEGEEDERRPVSEMAQEFQGTQKKLFSAQSGLFSKEKMDEEFDKHRRRLAADVNKALKMGKSRTEINEMPWDDFVKEAETFYSTSVEEAQAITDEKLKASMHELRSKNATLSTQFEALNETLEDRVAARTAAIEAERDTEAVDRLFNDIFNSDDFKWKDSNKDVDQFFIKRHILENYEVHRDGSITQNNGQEAVNFEGNGHYTSLKDPVKFLFESKKMGKQHRGGSGEGGSDPIIIGKVRLSGEMTDNSKATMNRAIAQRKAEGRDY